MNANSARKALFQEKIDQIKEHRRLKEELIRSKSIYSELCDRMESVKANNLKCLQSWSDRTTEMKANFDEVA